MRKLSILNENLLLYPLMQTEEKRMGCLKMCIDWMIAKLPFENKKSLEFMVNADNLEDTIANLDSLIADAVKAFGDKKTFCTLNEYMQIQDKNYISTLSRMLEETDSLTESYQEKINLLKIYKQEIEKVISELGCYRMVQETDILIAAKIQSLATKTG